MRINGVVASGSSRRNQDEDPKGKGKSAGKGKRGSKGKDRAWNLKKGWLGQYRTRPDRSDQGGKGGRKGSMTKYICFNHDPRSGKTCQKKECQSDPSKLHLDTTQKELAERFDRAKSAFESNKGRGKTRE